MIDDEFYEFYQRAQDNIKLIFGSEKHNAASASVFDVLAVLYDQVLRIDPHNPTDPLRDRFVLSKGHGPMSYYAILAAQGFIPSEELQHCGDREAILGYHPDHILIPGVEISSGSLGHGLPIAIGMLKGLELQANTTSRVFTLIGDAELDEGSNHEAILYAGVQKLDRLCVIVVDNQSSTHGWPGGIASHFTVAGWEAITVDGHDHAGIAKALAMPSDSAKVVVAVVEVKA